MMITGICEEEHEFETFAQEFNEQNDLHEVDADRNDFENVSDHEGLPPVNIMNVTGIVSNDTTTKNLLLIALKLLPLLPCRPRLTS